MGRLVVWSVCRRCYGKPDELLGCAAEEKKNGRMEEGEVLKAHGLIESNPDGNNNRVPRDAEQC